MSYVCIDPILFSLFICLLGADTFLSLYLGFRFLKCKKGGVKNDKKDIN